MDGGANHKQYKISNTGTGAMSPDGDANILYWSKTQETLAAWYPIGCTIGSGGGGSEVSITDQHSGFGTLENILHAPAKDYTYSSSNPVAFTFRHALAKVKVTLQKGDGMENSDLSGATVTFMGYTAGTLGYDGMTGSGNNGAITPKTMKLDLDVVMPQSKWKKSYGISNFTKGKKMTVTYSGGQYVWKETNEILTGGFYVHLDDVELTKAGSTLFLRMKLIQNALCYFIPQLLQTITLQPDGNLVANYTTSPVYIGSVPINNIDPDKDVGTIATFVTKFMIGLLTEKDINNALTDRTWTASPINLITWTEESGRLKINLNLPAIISLATKDGETPIDSGLVSGIMEALAQSNPVQLKLLLGIVNSMIDNPLLGIITSMDTASFQQVFYLLTEGIIFHIEEEDGHTHLYLTKESTTAFIQLLPGLQPIVEGMLPESMANNTVFKNLLGLLMGNDENGLPVLWNAANTCLLYTSDSADD